MTEPEVELVVQKAKEKYPEAKKPRLISDIEILPCNGYTTHGHGNSDSKIQDHRSACEPWSRVKDWRRWLSN